MCQLCPDALFSGAVSDRVRNVGDEGRMARVDETAVVLLSQVEWNLVWVLPQALATGLDRLGYQVIYTNPLPKRLPGVDEWPRVLERLLDRPQLAGYSGHARPPRVRLATPLALPDTRPLYTRLNQHLFVPLFARYLRRWLRGARHVVVIVFLPFPTPVALARALAPDLLIYACRSNWQADPSARHTRLVEDELFRSADLVLASGSYLEQRAREHGATVLNWPAMVDFASFNNLTQQSRPERQGPPRCVFFGHVNDRIDVELLRQVSLRYALRIVGPVSVTLPELAPGSELVGMVPHQDLPHHLQDVDVFLFPYRHNAFTAGIFPFKLFECFATGRPVVATGLPNLAPHEDLVYLSQTHAEFLAQIERAMHESPDLRARRIEVARQNSSEVWMDTLSTWITSRLGAPSAKRGPDGC